MPGYGRIDREYAAQLATRPQSADGAIYLLNLMSYKTEADYGPGGERGVTGREADDRYAPLDVLASIGATVCFVGEVLSSTEPWDRVAVVRYPTRRSFVDMQARPDFRKRHVHKEAGMDRTIIVGTLPVAGLPEAGTDAPLLLELWSDEAPAPADGPSAQFSVEGTIVGGGRSWRGVRFSTAAAETVGPAQPGRQAIVVRPVLARWT